ncbi:MAG: farnesyl diphosphate synthase [Eubacteriales bacterium]|nr:farnesyl diphosphate synthase [Eubacteriales bacterium]
MYQQYKSIIEGYLQTLDYKQTPEVLKNAMHYSLILPAKRLRGILVLASYSLIKSDFESVLPIAAAIEMIHAYSLIHDDLPCMDNDDLRRGKPTNHKVFGEDMAVLAGDGLLNYAHEMMLEYLQKNFTGNNLNAIHCISSRAGVQGMIAGQAKDITSTTMNQNLQLLQYIHQHKTADLIIAAVKAGLYLADASEKQIIAGELYAQNIGLAFQIIDDILDFTGSEKDLGKSIGKDKGANKLTWVTLYGIDQAKCDARILTQKAVQAIENEFSNADFFITLATQLLNRIQ